jgi:hypothetical protein
MKRKTYIIPQTETNVIDYSEGLMQEHSWTSGNGDDFPVVPGHPTDPTGDDDPYGGKEEAKGNTFGLWEE